MASAADRCGPVRSWRRRFGGLPGLSLRASEGRAFSAPLRILRPDGETSRKLGRFGPVHVNIRGPAPLDQRWRLVVRVGAEPEDAPIGSEIRCRPKTLFRATLRAEGGWRRVCAVEGCWRDGNGHLALTLGRPTAWCAPEAIGMETEIGLRRPDGAEMRAPARLDAMAFRIGVETPIEQSELVFLRRRGVSETDAARGTDVMVSPEVHALLFPPWAPPPQP